MPNFMGTANQNMSSPPQTMRARSFFTAFGPSDTSWTCPATGYYTFTARGPGGKNGGGDGAGSGGAAQKTLLLFTGQVVNFVVGNAVRFGGVGTPNDTVVTFPTGLVMTAGAGVTTTGGTASGGDTNVNGNNASANTGGAAPAIGSFPQANPVSSSSDLEPGPGVGGSSSGATTRNDSGSGILYLQAGKV